MIVPPLLLIFLLDSLKCVSLVELYSKQIISFDRHTGILLGVGIPKA
jgi:hypothetical protein